MSAIRARRCRAIASRLIPELSEPLRSVLLAGIGGSNGAVGLSEDEALSALDEGIADLALAATPPALAPRMRAMSRARAVCTLAVSGKAPSVAAAMRDAGIGCVVTKGIGLADSHPMLAQRTFTDIDLLVDPSRLEDAIEILQAMGFTERRQTWQPRRRFAERLLHAVPMTDGRIDLDLHHAIPPRFFGGRLMITHLLGAAQGIAPPVPTPVHAALIVALHIVHDAGERLRPWRDAAALLWDEDRAGAIARAAIHHGLEAPVYAVVHALATWLGEPPAAYAMLEGSLRIRDVRRLRTIVWGRRLGHHHARYALGLPSRRAITFLRSYLWPDRVFLESRVGRAGVLGRVRWWRDSMGRVGEPLMHFERPEHAGRPG